MKVLRDPDCILEKGLDAIRAQFKLPDHFPADAQAEAEAASRKPLSDHVDRTDIPFVTLDPASSMDLDQAFAIEKAGSDLILQYAIADVAWFVNVGGAMDRIAWERGESQYLPDGKISLYPPSLSEGAASLLPSVDRPAIIFSVRIPPDGAARLDGAERAVVRSRAKLAYDHVKPSELPDGFAELSRRIVAAEDARGAARIDPPEQEVVRDDGHYRLELRPQSQAEQDNASLSLACNVAVAHALFKHHTGLFRTMAEPAPWAVRRLRHSAEALGIDWPKKIGLEEMERSLNASDRKQAALMLAIRRASPGAQYEPYQQGVKPWHAAMAATYSHATAPLRRLADRYVVMTALAVANGKPVPDWCTLAFPLLPKVMASADNLGGQIERAVVDLAEAVMLEPDIGKDYEAIVTDTDERGARIQLCAEPVVARIKTNGLVAGDKIEVKLDSADPATRTITFSKIG
nr:RNB domain-containing ribonuclease [uncultured Sphingomonas sp.]